MGDPTYPRDNQGDQEELNKVSEKSRFVRHLSQGFEASLPFLLVWGLIIFLMVSGSVFKHSHVRHMSTQTGKPDVTLIGVKG